MNAIGNWTTFIIFQDHRQELYTPIFGGDTVPVKSIIPEMALLLNEHHLVYYLDIDAITKQQKNQLILTLARKFDIPYNQLKREMDTDGCPIKAAGTIACTTDHSMIANMLD